MLTNTTKLLFPALLSTFKQSLFSFFVLLLIMPWNASGQTIFTETFGQSITRLTSPYMPSGSYGWGNPAGTALEKAIENNYYAVIAPDHIVDASPVPTYWFWTGPEPTGNTGGSMGNPATNDHTGNANGAVMVVNAGVVLNDFYQRQVTLVPGNSYRLSVWMYLVNASSIFSMGVKDGSTNTVLGGFTSGLLSTTGNWIQYTYDFTYPPACAASGIVKVFLSNALSATGGNDYYIDDISLTTIAGPATNLTCPTTLPIQLESFNASAIDNNTIKINWKTGSEFDIKSFIVEKSLDGTSFAACSTVMPLNAAAGNIYEVTDNPIYKGSRLFYRLKTVDNNGRISYSGIVSVNLKNDKSEISAYPQPSGNGYVQLFWKSTAASEIELLNAAGYRIRRWSNYKDNKLSLQNLTSGLYFVRIVQGNQTYNKKIIVQ